MSIHVIVGLGLSEDLSLADATAMKFGSPSRSSIFPGDLDSKLHNHQGSHHISHTASKTRYY